MKHPPTRPGRLWRSGLFVLCAWLSATAGAATSAPGALDNTTCQTCHDTGKPDITIPEGKGDPRKLRAVPAAGFAKSVHAGMTCVQCHTGVVDAQANHQFQMPRVITCAGCHEDLLAKAAAAKAPPEKLAALAQVKKNIDSYLGSFHARPDADNPAHPKASCDGCHDTHTFKVPTKTDAADYAQWRQQIPNLCGQACHTDHLEDWTASAHGVAAQAKSGGKAAVCTDCHSTHQITSASAQGFKLAAISACGGCHEAQAKSYRDTYHGQVTKLGYTTTAKCSDCHGSHGILAAANPESKVHPDNKLKTCQGCHDGKKAVAAAAGFVSFGPHANTGEPDKYPQLFYVTRFMQGLLVGVFAFFWLHCLLWWYRERQERKHHPAPPTAAGTATGGKTHVRRFGAIWRVAHLCFALSVMTLVLTGITVLYAESAWAPTVVQLFGGPKTMGLVHRVAAAIMLGIFFLHLLGVATNILRNWKTFRFFGPDSLVPRGQDFKDAWGMFKWFFGKGSRPVFDRWTYWEKFDYWAVFWGMGIIGSSGMMLAFPDVAATYLPGWIFNVATIVHGEEAFLAAVFLFTVHFFNNHFRPEKLPPPDVVMFTGSQSLEEFQREHGAHYERLQASGDLDKHLVAAPSRKGLLSAKGLGLLLILFGLSLLGLVTNGFWHALH